MAQHGYEKVYHRRRLPARPKIVLPTRPPPVACRAPLRAVSARNPALPCFPAFDDEKVFQPMKKIRKAVFPVAGLGTRFLPATKAVPKEMLTVVDRPVIQYVVDEAREAGIEHFIFVTGRNKAVIEDHFDIQFELYETLRSRGKTEALSMLEAMQPAAGLTSFTRQQEPLGLGHAVWCARDIVGDEPFALLLPDMIMHSEPGCMKEMVQLYEETGANIVAVEECDPSQTHKYGIVATGAELGSGFEITGMVEKPQPEDAPSNLFINGRYILRPEIFSILETQERGAGNEIQLTDGMLKLLGTQTMVGHRFHGATYDCGSPEGFLEANLAMALARPELAGKAEAIARRLLARS
jgi:UTP--glucose-1-phosphate uridylyltransferase